MYSILTMGHGCHQRELMDAGDGAKPFVWFDYWLEGGPLCDRFRRLFYLFENHMM